MDVITAFLNGNIEEEILMEIPEGFQEQETVPKFAKSTKRFMDSSNRQRSGMTISAPGFKNGE